MSLVTTLIAIPCLKGNRSELTSQFLYHTLWQGSLAMESLEHPLKVYPIPLLLAIKMILAFSIC